MIHRGDLAVLTALSRGEPVLVYVNGGGPSCVFSLGVFLALEHAGLNHRIAARYGSSGGGINAAASVSNPKQLESVLDVYKYLVSGNFFRLQWDGFSRFRIAFDIDELFHVLEGRRLDQGLPALDGDKIRQHTAPLRVAVTDSKSGRGRFVDVKKDVFQLLRATASIQGACAPVSLGGREVGDGDVGKKIGPAYARAAKHVLVILNRPPMEERTWWEQWLSPLLMRMVLAGETEELRQAAAGMDQSFSRGLRRLEACKSVKTLVVYPDLLEDFVPLSANTAGLEYSMHNAMHNALRLIKLARAA